MYVCMWGRAGSPFVKTTKILRKNYNYSRTWLEKSCSPDYKRVGVTWEISLERLLEVPNVT